MRTMESDRFYLEQALQEADVARQEGTYPIGAVTRNIGKKLPRRSKSSVKMLSSMFDVTFSLGGASL